MLQFIVTCVSRNFIAGFKVCLITFQHRGLYVVNRFASCFGGGGASLALFEGFKCSETSLKFNTRPRLKV